jgi:Pyruvate/2-oxoacid:ferredoxin oxidoreductase delta subunit
VAVIFCQCKNAEIISPQVRETIESWFVQNQVAHVCVDDLCRLAAEKDPRMQEWAAEANPVVIACYPRAVRWLFTMAGANLKDNAQILNQRVLSAQEISEQLKSRSLPAGDRISVSSDSSWIPWFPTIDYSRCTNCRQCLNFCLFGVYSGDAEDKVEVARPANCKTGCPACSRVCPSAAIIFAKYTESPFNGDTVDEEKISQLRKSGDYKKWVADNLQKRLQMRNQLRQDAEAHD